MTEPVSSEHVLSAKVAIVTGAGQGIGEAIAHRFADAGAAVVVVDLAGEKAEAVAADLVRSGHRATALHADISSEPEVNGMISAALDEFGRIDILVNNAGIGHARPFLQ